MSNKYESPLITRYASSRMSELFSSQNRSVIWRKLWVALAKAEKECGLSISDEQIKELEANVDNIDFEFVKAKEKEVKHDVMAHIHTYGEVAPKAKGIIHLGATSCYVTDNADLIIYRDALSLVRNELLLVLRSMGDFANKYKSLPILGYTHYQEAQLVTVGRRMTSYMQDFIIALRNIDNVLKEIKFLGCRGATGTEASFMDLFNNDSLKIKKMNKLIANSFDFDEVFDLSGQTYTRIVDSLILNSLSLLAQIANKFATDLRLLEHDHMIEEPFGKSQVGSSAMAYKRNPIYSERICSLSRYLVVEANNAPLTYMNQWFERTLDDSANRRISIPESFLTADSILKLLKQVVDGLNVNEKVIEQKVKAYIPFIMTENILMEATKRGKDRQEVHEIIRRCSIAAKQKMYNGEECNLLELLLGEDIGLSKEDLDGLMDPSLYIGRSIEQVEEFLNKYEHLFKDVSICIEEVEF